MDIFRNVVVPARTFPDGFLAYGFLQLSLDVGIAVDILSAVREKVLEQIPSS